MRKFTVPEIVVANTKPNRSAINEGIDTGVMDGSGSLTVRASEAGVRGGRHLVFRGVEIEADSSKVAVPGYENWSNEALISEAKSMLVKDYAH